MTLDELTAREINNLVDILILIQGKDRYIVVKSNEEYDWIGIDMIDVSYRFGRTAGRNEYSTYIIDGYETITRLFK